MPARDEVDEVLESLFDAGSDPRVRVVGVGGAGGNVVTALQEKGAPGMETVVVNADPGGLDRSVAGTKIHLAVEGRGSELAVTEAAEASRPAIFEAVSAEVVFVVAGLGGATGTGAAPTVCGAARDAGAVVVTIAILPFAVESRRRHRSEQAVEELRAHCDSILLVDNDTLTRMGEGTTLQEAFALVNQMVAALVGGVVDRIRSDFLPILAEEVDLVARATEQSHGGGDVPVDVVSPPDVVEALTELTPVAFDDGGFIGWK